MRWSSAGSDGRPLILWPPFVAVEVTPDEVPRLFLRQGRHRLVTDPWHRRRAAGEERTLRGWIDRCGNRPFNDLEPIHVAPWVWDRAQQFLGIRMERIREEALGGRALHDSPQVHHVDAISGFRNDR